MKKTWQPSGRLVSQVDDFKGLCTARSPLDVAASTVPYWVWRTSGYFGTLQAPPPDQRFPPVSSLSPIKVDAATDRRIADAAHFLGRTKKDIVDAAVRDYVDAHRDEINASIAASLSRLDGTRAAVVSEITGLTKERLNELGGVPEL